MNADMFRAVADVIEREDRFNLERYICGGSDLINDCATVGCVAGWAVAITDSDDGFTAYRFLAAKVLGISDSQADRLFYGSGGTVWADQADAFGWDVDYDEEGASFGLVDWGDVTAVQAAKVLRMIADGEVTL